MLFAYIDESYIAGDVHLVSALVVDGEQLNRITLALDDIIWKTSRVHPEVRTDAELHGAQLFQRSADWACLREKPKLAFSIYRRALTQIAMADGKWFVGGVRRLDRLPVRYSDPWPPHLIALQYALELVDDYAVSRGETVRVIADQVQDQAHHQARIEQYRLRGATPGWKSRKLSSLEGAIRWEDSRSHRGLQAVDLLSYVYLRKRFVLDAHPRPTKVVARLADIARPILADENVWTP